MEQRVGVITLGIRELNRSRAFYEALGWHTRAAPDNDVVFFQAGGMIVALWDRAKLTAAWRTGADGVESRSPTTSALGETFWGGYSAAFLDPDGHPWEIAHNPRWPLPDDGSVELGA